MTTDEGNRVIGIRYALRKLKDEGLVDEDSFYPDQAVEDIQGEAVAIATKWYQIGARRCVNELPDAIERGDVLVEYDSRDGGGARFFIPKPGLAWRRRLRVKVGTETIRVKRREYRVSPRDMGVEE